MNELKNFEKRIAALEKQVQELPNDVTNQILEALHQREIQYAERACRAVLPRKLKENLTDSCVE